MKNRASLSVGFLFDDTLDSDNGVARHVKTLGAWLVKNGHQVTYLVGDTKLDDWAGGQVYSLSRNIGVTFNGNKMSVPFMSRKKKLKQVLDGHRFDILHVQTPYSPLFTQRMINLAPASTAVVGTFHIFPSGNLSRTGARFLRILNGRSLKRIGEMISVSQPAADFCKQSLGLESKVIPNPVNIAAYGHTAALPLGDSPGVVFLGRLVKRKGAKELIKAFAQLSEKLPDARLAIAGDGPQRPELEKLASKLGIGGKTRFLGRISEEAKPRLLAGADVACFPSLYGESFGLVLVEAMAAGTKTVLGGDNPGYRSVLAEQPDCLVNPLDTNAFASRLELLLTDKRLSRKLQNWQRRAAKQYDIEAVGPQILSVYRAAIARQAKNSHNINHE